MKIYRPARSYWMDDERIHVPSMDVIEREKGWVKTGLLDQYGNDLMACDYEPIGFVTNFERPAPLVKTKRKKR